MPIVTVCASAPESRYDIHIGHGLLKDCAHLFEPYRGRKAAVVADSNTAPLYSYTLMEQLHRAGVESSVIVLPAGEATKCPEELARLYPSTSTFLSAAEIPLFLTMD